MPGANRRWLHILYTAGALMPRSSPRKRSSRRRPTSAPGLAETLKTSLRAALWERRGSLDTLRDAICAFAADLNAKGTNAADIAAAVREAVLELRAAGAPLAEELAEADPSLDQTVAWCLEFADGPKNPLRNEDAGAGEPTAGRTGSSTAKPAGDRRRGPDRRNPTRLRGP
jgi:hypothetical protein